MAETEKKVERTVVKRVKNGILYSDGTITVQDVRISYPHVDKAWCKNPAKETAKFSAVGILPNDTHKEVRELLLEAVQEVLEDRNKGRAIKADAKFIRDGEQAAKPEYADAWTVSASEENRPIVLNPDKSEMAQEDIKPTFVAGHFVDLLIEPWWQDNEHGTRVNASLRAVRYRREGPAIKEGGLDKDAAISSFDDDDDGGFGGGDNADDDADGGL